MDDQILICEIEVPYSRPYKSAYSMAQKDIYDRLKKLVQDSGGQAIEPCEIMHMARKSEEHPDSKYIIFNMARMMEATASIDSEPLHAAVKELVTHIFETGIYVQVGTWTWMARYHEASESQIRLLATDEQNIREGFLTIAQREVLKDMHAHFAKQYNATLSPVAQEEVSSRMDAALNSPNITWDIISKVPDGLRVMKSIAPDIVKDWQIRHADNVVLKLNPSDFRSEVPGYGL